MNAVHGVIGVITVASLFVGRAVGAAHPGPPLPPAHELRLPPGVNLTDLLGFESLNPAPAAESPEPPRVDVYGNEIQEAVGDYRVDPGGGMYENHSPDTEVLHLGPKTS